VSGCVFKCMCAGGGGGGGNGVEDHVCNLGCCLGGHPPLSVTVTPFHCLLCASTPPCNTSLPTGRNLYLVSD